MQHVGPEPCNIVATAQLIFLCKATGLEYKEQRPIRLGRQWLPGYIPRSSAVTDNRESNKESLYAADVLRAVIVLRLNLFALETRARNRGCSADRASNLRARPSFPGSFPRPMQLRICSVFPSPARRLNVPIVAFPQRITLGPVRNAAAG